MKDSAAAREKPRQDAADDCGNSSLHCRRKIEAAQEARRRIFSLVHDFASGQSSSGDCFECHVDADSEVAVQDGIGSDKDCVANDSQELRTFHGY